MTISRNLGTVPTATVQANSIDWSWFVRIDIDAPVGTVRYTDRSDNVTADVDGSSQTWTTYDLKVGNIDQGAQDPGAVSWLDFANLDYAFTNWANTPGLRNSPVQVWMGWFDSGAYVDAIKLYEGHVDNHSVGERARLALKPWRVTWRRKCVSHIPGLSNLLPAPLMPEDGKKFYWNTDAPRG